MSKAPMQKIKVAAVPEEDRPVLWVRPMVAKPRIVKRKIAEGGA